MTIRIERRATEGRKMYRRLGEITSISVSMSTLALLVATAFAAGGPKKVVLSPSEIFQQETAGGLVTCGFLKDKWQPGTLDKKGSFSSRKAQLKALKKKINNAADDLTRAKLEKKRIKLQKKEKKEIPTCLPGPPATPTPTPTATVPATPTPTPTLAPGVTPSPTPTPDGGGLGCYDVNRDTTCFGIPTPFVGNETQGEILFQSLCATCHDGDPGPNLPVSGGAIDYSEIITAFETVDEMSIYSGGEVSTQDTAHLTAYLNRFNPNQ